MRALVFKRYGGPDQVAFADIPRPVPQPNEILIQVHAAGLNPVDNMTRAGKMKAILRPQLPATLGSDVAGVVQRWGHRSPVLNRATPFSPASSGCAQALSRSLQLFRSTPPRSNRRSWTSRKQPRSRWWHSRRGSLERACSPETRPKSVHPRRRRGHWHVRDPARETPRSPGGYDDQCGQRGFGPKPGC